MAAVAAAVSGGCGSGRGLAERKLKAEPRRGNRDTLSCGSFPDGTTNVLSPQGRNANFVAPFAFSAMLMNKPESRLRHLEVMASVRPRRVAQLMLTPAVTVRRQRAASRAKMCNASSGQLHMIEIAARAEIVRLPAFTLSSRPIALAEVMRRSRHPSTASVVRGASVVEPCIAGLRNDIVEIADILTCAGPHGLQR